MYFPRSHNIMRCTEEAPLFAAFLLLRRFHSIPATPEMTSISSHATLFPSHGEEEEEEASHYFRRHSEKEEEAGDLLAAVAD